MRFHVGKVPPDHEFQPERQGWKRLHEPTEFGFIGQAVSVGFVAAFAFHFWIGSLPPVGADGGRITIKPDDVTRGNIVIAAGAIIGGFALLLIVHELIHLLGHPGNGRSHHSVVGFLPKWCVCYAFYGGEITRNRFVLMLAAPFLVISVVPAVAFTFIGQQPPVWMCLVIFINALSSGGDLVAAGLVIRQLPPRTLLRHQSWKAYWKPGGQMPGNHSGLN